MLLDMSKIKTLRNYFYTIPAGIHESIFGKIETQSDIDLVFEITAERMERDVPEVFVVFSSSNPYESPILIILKDDIHELLDGVVDYKLLAGKQCTKKNYLRVDDPHKTIWDEKFPFCVKLDHTEGDLAMLALKAETELQVQFVEFLTSVYFERNPKK